MNVFYKVIIWVLVGAVVYLSYYVGCLGGAIDSINKFHQGVVDLFKLILGTREKGGG